MISEVFKSCIFVCFKKCKVTDAKRFFNPCSILAYLYENFLHRWTELMAHKLFEEHFWYLAFLKSTWNEDVIKIFQLFDF